MASTSPTNAAAEPRQQSDDRERGRFFAFGPAARTPVDDGGTAGPTPTPNRSPAHAAGPR